MLTVLNRVELFSTYSMQEQSRIRSVLKHAGIPYALKTNNKNGEWGRNRGWCGSFGIDSDYTYLYVFYVGKKDYERAKSIISSGRML